MERVDGLTVDLALEELSLPEPEEEEADRWWWVDPDDDRAEWELEVGEIENIESDSVPRVTCSACGWDAPALLVKNELCRYCRCKTCGTAQSLGSTVDRQYDLPPWLQDIVRHDVTELLRGLESWCLRCLVGHLCVICGAGPKVSNGRCDTCRKYRARTGRDRPERLRQQTPPVLHRLTTLLDPERLARAAASDKRDAIASAAHDHNLARLHDRSDSMFDYW